MGFTTILDILGATIVGGVLLLILFRVQGSSVENTYVYGGDLMVQQNLVAIVELLEYDFRKIGYCKDWQQIPDPSKAITFADSTKITFLTDIESDGVVDVMTYYLGPASELTNTENPRDRYLYRVINGATPRGTNLGVTHFNLRFFDVLGTELSFPIGNPAEIYQMEINISIENTAAYDNNYSNAVWKQIRLAARNLKNR
ncbi:MAG: hypothetical protein JEY94_14835 [Melioribacteraceae bacterium]|nr:hypothetical protein [Melioribacteraceae bacterium]